MANTHDESRRQTKNKKEEKIRKRLTRRFIVETYSGSPDGLSHVRDKLWMGPRDHWRSINIIN